MNIGLDVRDAGNIHSCMHTSIEKVAMGIGNADVRTHVGTGQAAVRRGLGRDGDVHQAVRTDESAGEIVAFLQRMCRAGLHAERDGADAIGHFAATGRGCSRPPLSQRHAHVGISSGCTDARPERAGYRNTRRRLFDRRHLRQHRLDTRTDGDGAAALGRHGELLR